MSAPRADRLGLVALGVTPSRARRALVLPRGSSDVLELARIEVALWEQTDRDVARLRRSTAASLLRALEGPLRPEAGDMRACAVTRREIVAHLRAAFPEARGAREAAPPPAAVFARPSALIARSARLLHNAVGRLFAARRGSSR